MLKLNNNGWGFSTFIAFIAIFCIAIILIAIGAIRLGISSKKDVSTLPVTEVSPSQTHNSIDSDTSITDVNTDNYTDVINNYETQLIDGTKSYIKNTSTTVVENDTFTITLVALVSENYISKLEIKGNTCTGYVTVFNNSGTYEYSSFLSCGNGYVTESYDSNLDESF